MIEQRKLHLKVVCEIADDMTLNNSLYCGTLTLTQTTVFMQGDVPKIKMTGAFAALSLCLHDILCDF